MLSRVADNLYWFGRYLQRAENTARLVGIHTSLQLDLPKKVGVGWQPLVDIVGVGDAFAKAYGTDASEANVVRFLLLDERNPASLLSSLHRAREILRMSRDTAPGETWEKLNDVHMLALSGGEKAVSRRYRQDFLNQVAERCLLISGMLVANMSRDTGFQFLRIGTNLEQADMTTRIIDVRSSSLIKTAHAEDLRPFQSFQWMSVLRSLAAYQMYRRHVRQRVSGPHVLRYLLQNREFPRSVVFCLQRVERTLPKLPANRALERSLQRVTQLSLDADIDKLVESGLSAFVDELQIGLGKVHEALATAFFRS